MSHEVGHEGKAMTKPKQPYPMAMKLAGLVAVAAAIVALYYHLISMAAKVGADAFLLPKIGPFVTRETLKVFSAGSLEWSRAGLYSFWACSVVLMCVFLMLLELWWPAQKNSKVSRALETKVASALDGDRA